MRWEQETEWLPSFLLPVVVAGGLMLIFLFADGFGCQWTKDLRNSAKWNQENEVKNDRAN